jgi:hypothetical protein
MLSSLAVGTGQRSSTPLELRSYSIVALAKLASAASSLGLLSSLLPDNYPVSRAYHVVLRAIAGTHTRIAPFSKSFSSC